MIICLTFPVLTLTPHNKVQPQLNLLPEMATNNEFSFVTSQDMCLRKNTSDKEGTTRWNQTKLRPLKECSCQDAFVALSQRLHLYSAGRKAACQKIALSS